MSHIITKNVWYDPYNAFNSGLGPKVVLFNGTNYDLWARQVKMALTARGFWTVTSGADECPELPTTAGSPTDPAKKVAEKAMIEDHHKWQYKTSAAHWVIYGNMEPKYQGLYECRDPNAAQLWERLAKDYLNKLSKMCMAFESSYLRSNRKLRLHHSMSD